MVSTTDDADHPRAAADARQASGGTGIDDAPRPANPSSARLDLVSVPVPGGAAAIDGSPALRGHPGGPGFAAPGAESEVRSGQPAHSVWQQAQAAWRAAGAEWRRPPGLPAGETRPGSEPFPARPPVPARERAPGRTLPFAVVAVLVVALAVAGVAAFRTGPGGLRGYPAARLAGGMFGAGGAQPGRGVLQPVSQVASVGDTVVAVGSQAGGDVPRAQFFTSRDGGSTWRLAAVRGPGGDAPAPGHPAQVVAGRNGDWLAVGPQAVWTSRDGQTWTLSSASGITPADAGDQVRVLTQTAGGFLAAGQNAAEGTAVIWTSPDGRHWQRMTAPQLGLPARGGQVLNIDFAAAHGRDIVIAGQIAATTTAGRGKQRHAVAVRSAGTWLSPDGGTSWYPSPVPVNHGAGGSLSGVAADGAGFVAVRPGTATVRRGKSAQAQPDGVVYTSATGWGWRYAATLTAPGGVQVGEVRGGAGGFTAMGQGPGGQLTAYRSADGMSWRPAAAFGAGPGGAPSGAILTGATVTASGAVVAAGSVAGPDRQQPYLAVAAPGRPARAVNFAAIPGATINQVAVDAVSMSGGRQVAVGEAGGAAAIWSRTARGAWALVPARPAPAPPPAGAPVSQELTSVAHGPAGWLAVGGSSGPGASGPGSTGPGGPTPVPGTGSDPVLVTSPDGTAWRTASLASADPGVTVAGAAAGPSGYVIVGTDVIANGSFPAVWWSGDLATWSRADAPALGGAGQTLAVAAGPSGFVAVGGRGVHPAVWTSADGRTWHVASLPVPTGSARAELEHVAVSGRHMVALGEKTTASGAQTAFAEVSADGGATWRAASLPAPSLPAPAPPAPVAVTAVTATSGGFMAVGTYGSPGNLDVAVWTSADGARFSVTTPHGTGLSGAGIQEITGLASSGATLTGVGFTATPSGEQPTVWDAPDR